jgi:hypothetical protein
VDDADVQRFIDVLMKDEACAAVTTPELAYHFALATQDFMRMTPGYATTFAEKLRQRVQWIRRER